MPLDTTLLKPAQIGTSEIATKNDIATSLGAYNPATVINTNTTTIDGGKITTGTITANHISTAGLNAGVIKAGVMYNTGGTSTTYTMKIDLDNGEIHIR